MKLSKPFFISSRLLPAVEIGGATIAIESLGNSKWKWYIDLHTGEEFSDADLTCHGSTQEAMEALLGFLGAFAESLLYFQRTRCEGENARLFPDGLREWAITNSEEISLLECDLQEDEYIEE